MLRLCYSMVCDGVVFYWRSCGCIVGEDVVLMDGRARLGWVAILLHAPGCEDVDVVRERIESELPLGTRIITVGGPFESGDIVFTFSGIGAGEIYELTRLVERSYYGPRWIIDEAFDWSCSINEPGAIVGESQVDTRSIPSDMEF